MASKYAARNAVLEQAVKDAGHTVAYLCELLDGLEFSTRPGRRTDEAQQHAIYLGLSSLASSARRRLIVQEAAQAAGVEP